MRSHQSLVSTLFAQVSPIPLGQITWKYHFVFVAFNVVIPLPTVYFLLKETKQIRRKSIYCSASARWAHFRMTSERKRFRCRIRKTKHSPARRWRRGRGDVETRMIAAIDKHHKHSWRASAADLSPNDGAGGSIDRASQGPCRLRVNRSPCISGCGWRHVGELQRSTVSSGLSSRRRALRRTRYPGKHRR